MTRVLILGGGGMLGHRLWLHFRDRFETIVTLRGSFSAYERHGIFDRDRSITGVDADRFDSVVGAFAVAKPDVVVNAIGIVKQLAAAKDPIPSLSINSLFPHRIAMLCNATGARLIHISTDCVFTGRKGMYVEADPPDAEDLYGRSKLLGEVGAPHLTLRTSIIGRELGSPTGLVDWFLSNRGGRVKGFRNAIFSGLTTNELARVIGDVIEKHRDLAGLQHVSVAPIDKLTLLELLREHYGADIAIEASDEPRLDRSLDSSPFRAATGWAPPSWPDLIREMAAS